MNAQPEITRSRNATLVALCLGLALLAGCATQTLRQELIRDPPSYAPPPAQTGPLADIANRFTSEHGEEWSGFRLLENSFDGLYWRLALIDSAVSSLEIQTYLWYPDNSGRLILDRALQAANRGVKVRLIVDDLLTIGLDKALYAVQQNSNVEVRLFNPWGKRNTLARAGEILVEMDRLNQRMHIKLLVADGQAAVVGGRNVGDHYFGLSEDFNFHDLDVLGFGHLARQANGMFDHFWNSDWVVSAKNLEQDYDPEAARAQLAEMQAKVRQARELASFPRERKDWSADLRELAGELHPGTSTLIYDKTTEAAINQRVAGELFGMMGLAERELLITNAYIIPAQPGIDFVRSLTERGVDVRILTNSLASHDTPAVNKHYKKWRDDFIEAGAKLFELRHDAAINQGVVSVPPVHGGFVGLHTKSFVVDRQLCFIGSMNLDPRSIALNAEAGAFIDSPGLAADLAAVMLRDMSPENAWQVFLDDKGRLYWVDSDQRVDRQPVRKGSQRIMEQILGILSKKQY